MKQHMQELRLRMQSTAATVDNSQRLGNRLTEALAQLLSQKTVSGILHTCATIGKHISYHPASCFVGIWPQFWNVICFGIVETTLHSLVCCDPVMLIIAPSTLFPAIIQMQTWPRSTQSNVVNAWLKEVL